MPSTPTTESSMELSTQATRLLSTYVRLLDSGDLDGWAGLFSRDAEYYVVTRENYDAGLPLGLVHDDAKSKIADRVTFIREFWRGSYNDYQQRHIASAPTFNEAEGDELTGEQSFAVYLTDADPTDADTVGSSLMCVGKYIFVIAFGKDGARFRLMRVVLDTNLLTRSFVYPL